MTQHEDFVHDVFQTLNAGEVDVFASVLAPDCDFVVPGFSARGPEKTAEWLRGFLTACPDLRYEVLAIAGEGDVVATELRVRGTHTGPLQGPVGEVQPTGRAFDVPAANIWRVRADRIAAYHVYFDQITVLQQLGFLPDPAAAR